MKAYKKAAISAAKGFHIGSLLNQIDEALLPEGAILLATEEGYLISEQDNTNNFITEE